MNAPAFSSVRHSFIDHAFQSPANQQARQQLSALLEDMRTIVCVGSGGVGKTTTAAALGLYAAELGKKTLVMTIDPAKRLANSLGLDALEHEPRRVDPALLAKAGLAPTANLWATMLDLPAAWDDMIVRFCDDDDVAQRILQNRFYYALSRELPGAQEFIACEALHHLATTNQFDLIVLDTPPTANALDFLEAPERILGFLDQDAFKVLVQGQEQSGWLGFGMRFLDAAANTARSVLSKFTGAEVLDEISDFLGLFRTLYEPLTERAKEFQTMLRSDKTRFVVVTSPEDGPRHEAMFFAKELRARGLPLGAAVVNRTHPPIVGNAGNGSKNQQNPIGLSAVQETLQQAGLSPQAVDALATALADMLRTQHVQGERDERALQELHKNLGNLPLVVVPRFAEDVHDTRKLADMLPWLVGRAV